MQFVGAAKAARRVHVGRGRPTAGAGDMPRHGVHRLTLSPESLGGAGVEEDISEEEADETGEASEAASGDSSDGGEAAGDSAENSDG